MKTRLKELAKRIEDHCRFSRHGGLDLAMPHIVEYELLKATAQAQGQWKQICEENGWIVSHDAWSHAFGLKGKQE